jgi:SAM-dependent methyltransferase
VSERKPLSGRGFDRRHGVTTHAVLFLSQLDPERHDEAHAHATHYEAVPPAALAALLALAPRETIARSTFVDVGAGMGRAVLLASEYPFAQIVGLELSPALYEIASDNVRRAQRLQTRCRDVRLVRADARKARFPRGDLVVFLYNPFDGAALDDVLDRLAERPKRGAEWILYHTPVHAERLVARGYALVAQTPDGAVYALPRTSRSFWE